MKFILKFLLFFISLNSFGQIIFQKGYFINNEGKRNDCLIKNIDWRKNPKSFKFKFSETEKEQEATIENVQEFGIEGYNIFIRKEVDIDISSDNIQNLTPEKNPIWEKRVVFLKILRSGEFNLFSFEGKDNLRFFFSKNNGEIKQLVFKRYLNGPTTGLNETYKQQLINAMNPEKINQEKILKSKYRLEEFENIFDEYNGEIGNLKPNIQNKIKRKVIEVKLTPGISFPNFKIEAGNTLYKYDPNLEYRLGFEIDAILPFNMNKWSLYIEPTFFTSKIRKKATTNIVYKDIDVKLFSLPVGIKGKSFLQKESVIFYHVNYDFGLGTGFKSTFSNLNIEPGNNFAIGAGFEKKKMSLELRYISSTNLLRKSLFYLTDYQRVQFIFGYKIFEK